MKNNSGQILTELIIAIAITAILAAIGAQLLNVSLYSVGTSEDRQAASRLAEEIFEALRAVTQGNTTSTQGWNRLYLPPDGSGNATSSKGTGGVGNPFYVTIVSNQWQIASGTEDVILEGKTFTRRFFIENICRDNTNHNISTTTITTCLGGTYEDPGTQKITAKISKTGAPDFEFSEYFTRYLNESSPQNSWQTQACNVVAATSSPTVFCDNISNRMDTNLNCSGASTCLRIKQQ